MAISGLEEILKDLAEGDAGLNKILGDLLPLHTISEAGISNQESLKRLQDCREKGAGLTHGAYEDDVKNTFVVENLEVPLLDKGPAVRVKLHKPVAGGKDLPLVIWCHGGGLTVMDYMDNYGSGIFKPFGSSLCWASVDYRLAPEAKFPAPVDDVVATYNFFTSTGVAHKHGINTKRIGMAGVSAGGFLVGHAACRLAQMRQLPAFLAMMYPMVHPTPLLARIRHTTKTGSFAKYGVLAACPGKWLEWSWQQSLGDGDGIVAAERCDDASLLKHDWTLLKDVPTMLVVGQMDCLYDEGVSLAECLQMSGVKLKMLDPKGSHTVAHMHDAEASKQITSWWSTHIAAESKL